MTTSKQPAETDFTICSVHEAIARAKAECSPVGKDGYNEQQRFKFRGVDAVVNGAARALNRYGVIIIPTIKLKKIEKRTYTSKGGSTMMHALVPVVYRLYGADGSGPVEVEVVGEASDAGDKGISKATSVAYRIMLLQVLNLPTGDPDPDSETHERDGGAFAGGDPWQNARPARSRGRGNQQASNRPASAGDAWEQAAPAAPQPSGNGHVAQPAQAPEDDPALVAWAAKIDEITDMTSAMTVREELGTSNLDPERAAGIGRAIDAKLATLTGAQRPSRNRGPSATERGAQAVPVGKGDDGEWVKGWQQRLADATTDEALSDLQRQIGPAVGAKTISPAKSAELAKALKDRRNALEQVPA